MLNSSMDYSSNIDQESKLAQLWQYVKEECHIHKPLYLSSWQWIVIPSHSNKVSIATFAIFVFSVVIAVSSENNIINVGYKKTNVLV